MTRYNFSEADHMRADIIELKHAQREVVYIPTGQKDVNPWHFGGTYHDRRIGWVEPREFNTYQEYIEYLKTIPETKMKLSDLELDKPLAKKSSANPPKTGLNKEGK